MAKALRGSSRIRPKSTFMSGYRAEAVMMKRLQHGVAIALLLALAACATPKNPEADISKPQAPPAEEQVSIRDKVVVPGERVGPILLGMSLRKLIEVVG